MIVHSHDHQCDGSMAGVQGAAQGGGGHRRRAQEGVAG